MYQLPPSLSKLFQPSRASELWPRNFFRGACPSPTRRPRRLFDSQSCIPCVHLRHKKYAHRILFCQHECCYEPLHCKAAVFGVRWLATALLLADLLPRSRERQSADKSVHSKSGRPPRPSSDVRRRVVPRRLESEPPC